jgi:hypothetical protein
MFNIWECLLALIHTSPICQHSEESQSAGDRRFGREALQQTRSTGTEQSNQPGIRWLGACPGTKDKGSTVLRTVRLS